MQSKMLSLLPLLLQLHAASANPITARVNQAVQNHAAGPSSCNSQNTYNTSFPDVVWDQDGWCLSTHTLNQGHYEARGSVANGYLGINVASVGPFFEFDVPVDGDVINGWPLFDRRMSFATISGFWDEQPRTNGTNFPWLYQYGGESVISGVPHWAGLVLDLGPKTYLDATVDSSTISDFTTIYDYKSGVLSWSYKWQPAGNMGTFDITYRLFAHKLLVNQAVVDMEVTASQDTKGSVVNVLDGASAVRTDFVESGEDDGAIFSAVRPWGISNITAYIYANMTGCSAVDLSSRKLVSNKPYLNANASSIAQSVDVHFPAGTTVHVTKFIGGASTDAFADPKTTAKKACAAGEAAGYESLLKSHVAEWANVMPESSVDDFTYPGNGTLPADQHIIESQIISVVNTYYLLQNTVSQKAISLSSGTGLNTDSISVGGLTSESYAGLVFWDADVWMQPGLVAAHPEAAQRITNYRAAKYPQAKANVGTAYQSSKNQTYFSPDAAVYSWTSGRWGNCTGTGPCWDYEYHLNGDIALSIINQYVASGDTQTFKEKLFPIFNSVATLFSDLVQPNGTAWTLTNMTDPDEYANHVDAGGYTMPLIAQTLIYANEFRQQFGLEANQTWNEIAQNVLVIRDDGVTLEFTTMNGSAVVKQADVVLDTYPLDYTHNYTQAEALNDLDYYANKQSPDGPAMTYAIFAAVANAISPSGCSAYTYAQYAYRPYTRAPFFQLSEQLIDDASKNGGTHPAYPFLTGHGGALQVNLFGFLGFRYLPDNVIHIDPNLPPQIPHITYRTFYWRGCPFTAASNYTHTTLSRATDASCLPNADPQFTNAAIPVHVGHSSNPTVYQLPVTGTLTVQNRMIASQNTLAGNLVQCHPVQSTDPFVPGQFPISAVDGASSTKWQPLYSANTSSVTVSLADSPFSACSNEPAVSGFSFDWAQNPPVDAAVLFHNTSFSASQNPANTFSFSSAQAGDQTNDYTVITVLRNIAQSNPYKPGVTNLDAISIPTGNSTNVTLAHPVPAARYATLLVKGNQANTPAEVQAKNGTGATVAEWNIIGAGGCASGSGNGNHARAIPLDTAAKLKRTVAGVEEMAKRRNGRSVPVKFT